LTGFSAPTVGSGVVTRASKLPMVTAIVFLVASVLLYVFRFELANNWYFLVGYLLTPVGVTATVAWDLKAQRKGQVNPNFDVRPQYTKILRVLAVLGYVVGIFHIIELGTLLGQWVVQSGFVQ